ncbi:hypothetical protein HY970_02155 [Candidatus Kaiserbacteria bacterium]|nr:hypothetical protein [Candidatus Kaiserbacteria bacterium]
MTVHKLIGATALLVALTAGVASAQTSSSSTSTVGTPNTGAGGGSVANVIVLTGSALVALAGLAYLARRTGPK